MVEREYETGEVPVFRALYLKQTWGGVPRSLFLINVLVCIFAVIILGAWQILGVGIGTHFLFKYFTAKDPEFFEVFIKYLQGKDFYKAE